VDVTIVYPGGRPTFWAFLCGRTREVVVRARQVPIPPEFCLGDYAGDPAFRGEFQQWLEHLWAEKDVQIGQLVDVRKTNF
jgi:hypothetical protein